MLTIASVNTVRIVSINQTGDFGIIEMIESFEHALSSVVIPKLDEIFFRRWMRR